ncbi:MAG: hypothetical protein NVSMB62_02250 [Acidobacteriaceae bacterium]
MFTAPRTALLATAAALALTFSGCKSTSPTPDDASLASQVQARLSSDPLLSGQAVKASVAGGVATLSGIVTSDSARTNASGDAAQITGIRTVVNDLTVQTAAAAPAAPPILTPTPAPEPMRNQSFAKPSAATVRTPRTRSEPRTESPSDRQREQQPEPQSAPIVRNSPPVQTLPPPPPPPVVRNITIPSGTVVPIRITQTLDSATTQQGDKFTGAVASDIVIDGVVALAQGTPVTGHVDAVQDATHFTGSSLLTISLNSINRKGERLDISTEPFTKQGQGRGKNTAEKVGGGAAVGAILGGILGGGRGAAIGTAAGAGVGAGAQGITRGQQVQIPSESIIRFRTTNELLVRGIASPADSNYPTSPGLERRTPNPNQ